MSENNICKAIFSELDFLNKIPKAKEYNSTLEKFDLFFSDEGRITDAWKIAQNFYDMFHKNYLNIIAKMRTTNLIGSLLPKDAGNIVKNLAPNDYTVINIGCSHLCEIGCEFKEDKAFLGEHEILCLPLYVDVLRESLVILKKKNLPLITKPEVKEVYKADCNIEIDMSILFREDAKAVQILLVDNPARTHRTPNDIIDAINTI